MRLSRSVVVALCLGLCVPLAGCGRSSSPSASSGESPAELQDALIEGHEAGTVSWTITPDGKAQAVIKDASGKLITAQAAGQVTFKTPGVEQTIPLKLNEKTSTLEADGPKLQQDLNEVRYALVVDGKPWIGSLMLPTGGTKAVVDQARTAEATVSLEAGVGPHGGIIQVVGEDRLELVAEKGSGRVRVYVLGPDLQPIAVGPRKLKLGVNVRDGSEIVILNPSDDGAYCEGRISLKAEPIKLTVSVSVDARTSVAIIGWHPGVVLVVGHHAHPVHLWADVHFDDDHHDHGHGHAYGRDNVKVDVKIKGGGNGGGKIKVKVH